jgi:hypothetical protein
MAWPPEFLRRFRPAGTPGAAARAGVPVDRAAEAAGELAPVLALLADVESATAEIREGARLDAMELRDQARARGRRRPCPGPRGRRVDPPGRPGPAAGGHPP